MNVVRRISSCGAVLLICMPYALWSFSIKRNTADYYAVCKKTGDGSLIIGMIQSSSLNKLKWLRVCDPKSNSMMTGMTTVLENDNPRGAVAVWESNLITRRSNNATICLVQSKYVFKGGYRTSVYSVENTGVKDVMSTCFIQSTGELLPFLVCLYHAFAGIMWIGAVLILLVSMCCRSVDIKNKVYRWLSNSGNQITGQSQLIRVGFICAASAMTISSLYCVMFQNMSCIPIVPIVILPSMPLICALACIIFGMTGKDGVKVFVTTCAVSTVWIALLISPFLYVAEYHAQLVQYSIESALIVFVIACILLRIIKAPIGMHYCLCSLVYFVLQMLLLRVDMAIVRALVSQYVR